MSRDFFRGKSCIDKYVLVSLKDFKSNILFEFDNEESAMKFYDSFDYSNEKLSIKKRLNLFFCKHPNEYYLDVGSKYLHYIHCPDCSRAIYVNDESEEDRNIRKEENWKISRLNEIKLAEKNILHLKQKFKDTYGEDV